MPEAAPEVPDYPSGMVRAIDTTTGEYSVDTTTGNFTQTTALRQRIVIRLRTVLASALAQMTLGLDRPKKIGRGFVEQMQQAVRDCLRQETDVEKVMQILGITVETGGARAAVQVKYRDRTTNEVDTVKV